MNIFVTSTTINEDEIQFEMPQIYLEKYADNQAYVIDFYIKWKEPPGGNLFALRSNIIPRSSGNPTQDLAHFSTTNNHSSVHYQPSNLLCHKIQIVDVQDMKFYLHSYTSEAKDNVDFICLHLGFALHGCI